jgi:transposase InsO family protein
VAKAYATTRDTVRKWVRRYQAEGDVGLRDRTSRPVRSPNRTAQEAIDRLTTLRTEYRLSGPELAEVTGVPSSTVGRWLRRAGLGRLRRPGADEPARRYERLAPGDLLHIDVKKLARFAAIGHGITGDRRSKRSHGVGYDFLHVAIDDHSRLAYVEVHRDETGATAVAFLQKALQWFAQHGVHVVRLMSDNGSCYRSRVFAEALRQHAIRHIRTRPYTPKTNGKVERFNGTLAREWAYSRPYANSAQRNQYLGCWLRYYNERRPHGSLARKPPISRVPGYNVVSNNI